MTDPFIPIAPNFRTIVYAIPAPSPPPTPIIAGSNAVFSNPGFTINRHPAKAVPTQAA